MPSHFRAIGLVDTQKLPFLQGYEKVCTSGSERRLCFRKNEPEREEPVIKFVHQLWSEESGQDIAEYAVMLAVILVIVVGTIRLIGSNANTVFSQVGSAIQ
jgi:pilus assembly protein Flp/PilA